MLTSESIEHLEEGERRIFADDRHDQGTIEVAVVALAGWLGDEEAAMAGRALEPAFGWVVLGFVRGADRVVRAEARRLEARRFK